ncbi:MAG: leucyl aminopeptidase [Chloroflexi bacterium]|nr:leucyl aminopeptidase [Chloroflexota bacterium]
MEVRVQRGAIQDISSELIVVNLFKGVSEPTGATGVVDRALGGAIRELIAVGDLTGEEGQTALLYPRGAIPARRVLVVGLGERERFGLETVRRVSAEVVRTVARLGVRDYHSIVHGAGAAGLDAEYAAQAVAEGTVLGNYRYRGYRTQDGQDKTVDTLTLVEFSADALPVVERGARRGQIVAESACLARDLANEPANRLTPAGLAKFAKSIAEEVGLACDVLGEKEMESLGMGALLGVARGSEEPAQFIVLEHGAVEEGRELDTVVIVGKGITFDSGGISLKDREGMERMKYDMSGAAVALATARAAALLHLPLHVVALIPATENLPGGRAYKPGDVLTTLSGQTIEVISTDAEGRLILADALAYAERYRPKAIVDLATLTGGCIVALGHVASGLMGNDAELLAALKAAAARSGEKVWELPLFDEYKEQIKSDVADVKNSGGREASAIVGGLFLSRFVGDCPWAHLDIAGTAWADKEQGYLAKGATGWGVRLLAEWLQSRVGS